MVSQSITTQSLILQQLNLLKDLFSEEWFNSETPQKRSHPAFTRWHLCKYILDHGCIIKYPVDKPLLHNMTSLLLDNSDIVQISDGKIQNFSFGNFLNYGSEKLSKIIQSVIHDPKKFLSLMTEISFASWNQSKGYNVSPFDHDGYPEYSINYQGIELPVLVECKYLHTDTNNTRVGKIIYDANKKIKNVDANGYGLLVVNLSEKVPKVRKLDDGKPQEVIDYSSIFSKNIKKHNSAVSAILLFWDEIVYVEEGTDPKGVLVCLRRKSEIINHQNPIYRIPSSIPFQQFGNTVEMFIELSARPSRRKRQPLIRRNSPCYCKSEKRYKNCCGKIL